MQLLVAASAILGSTQLVHFGHALLELIVLALFVGMSLVLISELAHVAFKLDISALNWIEHCQSMPGTGALEDPYLALPWKVVLCLSAFVQRNQEVRA